MNVRRSIRHIKQILKQENRLCFYVDHKCVAHGRGFIRNIRLETKLTMRDHGNRFLTNVRWIKSYEGLSTNTFATVKEVKITREFMDGHKRLV